MPTDCDVLCLRNGTSATINEMAFLILYVSTFASLVTNSNKMFRLVAVVDLKKKKKSTQ